MTAVLPPHDLEHADDAALADRLHESGKRIRAELRKVIVGQDQVVELALTALFAGGNCLLVGVPGLAKTLLIQSMARALDLRFSRIIRLGGNRTLKPNLDVYNLLNASNVINQNLTYGPAWRDATQILAGRLLRVGVQFDF